MRTSNGLALCVCVCATYLASYLPARGVAQTPDPDLVYHTLHTPSFDITYHDPLGELAQRLAVAAERANSVLSHRLQLRAQERTLILLTDDADDANGFAGVIPRNEIHLFAAAPDDLSPLGDYDDWIATIVTHEHTHVLHLDQIGGTAGVINAILGKTVAPNALQPRWFIEGLATYAESAHSAGGRMRSSMYDMFLRMDALAGELWSLAQLSNDPLAWPHGEIRYLYGSRFVEFIARHHGEAALTRMASEYGSALLPYGLNRVAKHATGFTFVELYDRFRQETRAHYLAQRDRILSAGLIEGTAIVPQADLTRGPRFLRDGRLAYYREDGRSRPQLRTLDGRGLGETSGEAVFSPEPAGGGLIYSQLAPYRDVYSFHDLFRLDLASGASERLTVGLRASQPDVAPSGRQLAFVTQQAGSTRLELAELADIAGTRRTLYQGQPFEQVFTPRFSPDGQCLVVSAWRQGGYRDILLIELATGTVRELTHDRAVDTGPTFSPDGRQIYFSSDRSGVPNIYAYERASGATHQVTNVVGGAFQPVVSPDGMELVFVDYGSEGFGLRRLELQRTPGALAEPYFDPRPAPHATRVAHRLPTSPYSPLDTLLPSNYRLELAPGPFGRELALSVGGQDLAGYHNYAVRFAQSLESAEVPSINLRYTYSRSALAPSLRLFRDASVRRDLRVAGRPRAWTANNLGATLALGYRFPDIRRSQTLDFDYSVTHVSKAGPFGGKLDPNDPAPVLPELGVVPSAGFGYRYSDVTRQAYDISPSSGRSLSLHVDATDPIMGRDERAVALRWELEQYLALPWSDLHVLALRYAGGLSGGTSARIRDFSLGGFPDDVPFPSIYDVALFGALHSIDGVALRGYPEGHRSGTHYHHIQAEYRLPLLDLEWGVYTLPFYVRRAWLTVFADLGDAFTGDLEPKDLLFGTGGELFVSFVLAYRITLDLRTGIARGLVHGGETQLYVHLGSPF